MILLECIGVSSCRRAGSVPYRGVWASVYQPQLVPLVHLGGYVENPASTPSRQLCVLAPTNKRCVSLFWILQDHLESLSLSTIG